MLKRATRAVIAVVLALGSGWLLVPSAVAAEAKPIDPTLLKRFEARVFQDPSGGTLKYRLFKPSGVTNTSSTNFPLVLFLHGAAGLGDDNQRQFNGGNEVPPLALTDDDAQSRFPSFVLVPQCPRGESWSGYGDEPAKMIQLTFSVMAGLAKEFPIDPKRIYLVGVSMGGSGTWNVATRFPKKFAAIVPICGAGDPEKAKVVASIPTWCFHGGSDPLVSVDYARRMIAAIKKVGGNPRYTEYPGVGHDSYRNAFKEPELLPWLFGQVNGSAKR